MTSFSLFFSLGVNAFSRTCPNGGSVSFRFGDVTGCVPSTFVESGTRGAFWGLPERSLFVNFDGLRFLLDDAAKTGETFFGPCLNRNERGFSSSGL